MPVNPTHSGRKSNEIPLNPYKVTIKCPLNHHEMPKKKSHYIPLNSH
jgi:hypothetical protein